MKLRLGIDVGGTFTDIVIYDDENQRIDRVFKIATESGKLVDNLVSSIKLALTDQVDERQITILHGTTIGLNTLLQESGAKAALVTTRGFRDVYELGRQWRGQDVYNLFARPPKPLVPRNRIIEVDERIGSVGEVVTPLHDAEIERVVALVRELDVEAVAVCFLFSFLNSDHERRVGAALQQALPNVSVSLSSEVVPEFREYERTSTVAIDAYVKPTVTRYLSQLEQRVSELGGQTRTYIMRSGGGLATVREAGRLPVQSMFSGPVAGVMGASYLGQALGWSKIITLDMGGTSTDMALVLDGQPLLSKDREIGGRPMNVPTVEVNSIGSGGGSLASLFAGKAIKVGPESAGANPGPVCYGRGGVQPTLTDAWSVAGHLPTHLLDGELSLDRKAATRAIEETVAKPLGISVGEAAGGIINVATSQSYELLRLLTVERGYDPTDFNLITFGGAGPVYAAAVARDLGIPRVCIPRHPGLFSAFGFLTTDLVQDYAETRISNVTELSYEEVQEIWTRLEKAALDARPEATLHRSVDLRYKGQAYEVMVSAPEGPWSEDKTRTLAENFHQAHEKRYGLGAEGEPVEFVVFRIRSSVSFPRPLLESSEVSSTRKAVPSGERPAFFDGEEFPSVNIFRRDRLAPGDKGDGPAVIEEFDTTTVVYPKQCFEIDPIGNIIITIK